MIGYTTTESCKSCGATDNKALCYGLAAHSDWTVTRTRVDIPNEEEHTPPTTTEQVMDAIAPGLCELMTIDQPGYNNLDITEIAQNLEVNSFWLADRLRKWVNTTTQEVETRHRQNLRRQIGCHHDTKETDCGMCTPTQGDCTYCDCCPGNECNPYQCENPDNQPGCECHNRT